MHYEYIYILPLLIARCLDRLKPLFYIYFILFYFILLLFVLLLYCVHSVSLTVSLCHSFILSQPHIT